MAKSNYWYSKTHSLTKLIVWNADGTETMTYHSKLALDKQSQRRGSEDLLKRLYLESKDPRKWVTAILYNNQTGAELGKWVDKIKVN